MLLNLELNSHNSKNLAGVTFCVSFHQPASLKTLEPDVNKAGELCDSVPDTVPIHFLRRFL